MSENKHRHEHKTMWVAFLTALTMAVEIAFGLMTKSMALLADGIHMGSHALVIGLSWITYIIVRRVSTNNKFKGNSAKILSLSGFSSGLMLLVFVIVVLLEAIKRFFKPVVINYNEAILIAIICLIVNVASAFLLYHEHEKSDHNIRAAYLHVIADAFTSLSAVLGLTAAMIWDVTYIDTIAAILSSFLIVKWSVGLLKDSGKVLLDIQSLNNKRGGGL